MGEIKLKSNSYRSPAVSAAISISEQNTKFRCSLCSYDKVSSDHKLNLRPIYSDSETKLKKIKLIGGCLKCGLINHTAKTCLYRFSKLCYKCNLPHMSFLCHKDVSNTVYTDDNSVHDKKANISEKILPKHNRDKAKTSTASTVTFSTNLYNDIILPTGTAYVDYSHKLKNFTS